MSLKQIYFLVLLSFVGFRASAGSDPYEEHTLVTMRMIGHQLLLADGDSNSRVLPITKIDNRYKIEFSDSLAFEPDYLAYMVDSILIENRIASSYILEVTECDSSLVIYSYEVAKNKDSSLLPCFGRNQPKGCYSIFIRVMSPPIPFTFESEEDNTLKSMIGSDSDEPRDNSSLYYIIALGSIILFSIYGMNRRPAKNTSHLIPIGSFHFDQKNMSLIKGNRSEDLTGKETDLLQLLHQHINSTVDREVILKEVWRDEGAYIGRTLDVYISKLRKKFESDPKVNFINVRGIGYKMTMD